MTIAGFPNDHIPAGTSCTLRTILPVDCNRIVLRGSRGLAVVKLVIGKDAVVYDGGPSNSSIRGDILVHGIRVHEGQKFSVGLTAVITVINVSSSSIPAEIYMILRLR